MAVAASTHIARRTIRHTPQRTLRDRWNTFRLRYSQRALTVYFERTRQLRPVTDPNRHAWESPDLEDAFARLAADHPTMVTPSDGGPAARDADREQLLLAVCDHWFRETHPAPEHRWSPDIIAAHTRLLANVHACFHPGGEA